MAPGPSEPLVVKDVEAQLLKDRKCKRKPGQLIYPLEYSSDLLDLYINSSTSLDLPHSDLLRYLTATTGIICSWQDAAAV